MTSRNPTRDKAYPAVRLKHACTDPGQYGLNVAAADYADEGVRLIRTSDIQARGLTNDDEGIFITGPVEERFQLRYNDLVLSRAGTIGRAFLAPREAEGMAFAGFLVRFRPRPNVVPRFLFYVTQGTEFQQAIQRDAVSNTISNFNAARYASLSIPLPPQAEQDVIADFLDRETAQIDAMIEAEQDLVNLLHERKLAVLDSAFQPFSSRTIQLRRATTLVTSGSRGWAEYYADEGQRFLRIGNLSRGSLGLRGEIQYVDLPLGEAEGSRTRLREGDLLFSITAYLGSVGVVESEWVGAFVSQHVGLCRLDPSVFDPRFVGYYMLSSGGQNQLKEGAYGGAKMQLGLEDLHALNAPAANLSDQRAVVAELDHRLNRIDALASAVLDSIALMQERRSALISAAVTGQIDPRTGREIAPEMVLESV